MGAFEAEYGADATPFADEARRRFFPQLDKTGWSKVVLAASVRAYVPPTLVRCPPESDPDVKLPIARPALYIFTCCKTRRARSTMCGQKFFRAGPSYGVQLSLEAFCRWRIQIRADTLIPRMSSSLTGIP